MFEPTNYETEYSYLIEVKMINILSCDGLKEKCTTIF